MTQFLIIRPGATAFDEQNRLQGTLDLPLSAAGLHQVVALTRRIRFLPLKAVYHGPCSAAHATAAQIAHPLGLLHRPIDLLRNLDLGLWQGLHLDHLRKRNPRLYRLWRDDLAAVAPPAGESIELATHRALLAIRPLIKRHRDEMIALVVADPMARIVAASLRGDRRIPPNPSPPASFVCMEASPSPRVPGHGAAPVSVPTR